jgi:hypothetical protein
VYDFLGGEAQGAQVGDPVPERGVPADGAADARGHHDARPRARALRAHEGGEAAGREPRADRARRALRCARPSPLPSSLLTRAQIVEELEDRFGEQMDDVLTLVRASLSDAPVGGEASVQGGPHARDAQGEPDERWAHEDDAAEQELVFDDDGAGAGVEGDLDMEDD